MASRVMHMAVTRILLDRETFKDPQGLLAGALLPDAPRPSENSRASHFKCDRGGRRTYDLAEFRCQYGNRLAEEGLYLGYYLHLIQDLDYRRLIYGKYNLRSRIRGQLERLYQDYSILNGYIIEKYQLVCPPAFPTGIEEAAVCRQFGLDPQGLLASLQKDFESKSEGDTAFFSREMAEEYIQTVLTLCEKELESVKRGRPLLDPWALAWNTRRDT